MPKEDEIKVQIRERANDDAEYERPAIALPQESEEGSGGSEDEESSEEEEYSSDEEEDENAALLTPALDSQILRTIAAIQTKDPSVYDTTKAFFDKGELNAAQKEFLKKKQAEAKKEGKKYTLKDYEREVLLEHGGYIEEEEEQQHAPKTHYQEQRDLKNEFMNAAREVDSDEEEEEGLGGGLLEKRVKTEEEEKAEDEAYRKFMLQNIAADEASSKAFKDWNANYKENPNVTKEDAFLIDYVLNRGWMEKPGEKKHEDVDRDVDEEHLDEIDRFESNYNFRFEEEGGANIVSYSRNIDESVRRKKNKRQLEREKKKARKEAALREKAEELARARNLKMKEIHQRLKEIQEITGNSTVGLDKIDLDGDFDPEKYDEQMKKVFDARYYDEGDQDNVKPTWDDDIDTAMYENEEDDEDVMMDADYLPGGQHYEDGKKRKRGVEVQQEQAEKKQKTKELLDEYYALNFEDIIGGDLPTRYKYRKTEAEDYGLTAEEILLADDTELNKYVGLKMMAPYRNPKKHEKETRIFKKNQYKKYSEFRKHFETKLNAIDPKGAAKWRSHDKGDGEKKKLRKRRGKKKKEVEAEA